MKYSLENFLLSNLSRKDMSVENIRPLYDMVVVGPLKKREKTAGGILIPDNSKEKPQEGIVISVGPGKKDEPMSVRKGDHVLFSKYGGTEFSLNDETFIIMKESEILAIITD